MTALAPLAGLRPAAPPTELRARVLTAAAHARAKANATARWIDRAWESRVLRVAWSVTLLASLLGHLAVTWGAERSEIARRSRAARAEIVHPSPPFALPELR